MVQSIFFPPVLIVILLKYIPKIKIMEHILFSEQELTELLQIIQTLWIGIERFSDVSNAIPTNDLRPFKKVGSGDKSSL